LKGITLIPTFKGRKRSQRFITRHERGGLFYVFTSQEPTFGGMEERYVLERGGGGRNSELIT